MRAKKFKRKFYRNIPVLFFLVILLSILFFTTFSLGNSIVSKQNFFISPLARAKNSNNYDIQSLLIKNNIQFSKIEREKIFIKNGGIVYLDLDKNLPSQISSLQLILSRLTIEGKKFKKLDLRFDKPIIEF